MVTGVFLVYNRSNELLSSCTPMLKKLTIFGIICLSCFGASSKGQQVSSLEAPTLPTLQSLNVGTSGTLNQTISTGSKASLSFGSSTSFGASASLSGTSSTSTQVTSRVKLKDLDVANQESDTPVSTNNLACPTGNCISTRLGETVADGTTARGTITAEISNLRANNQTDQNSPDSNYTNGSANLGGVNASNDLVLDGFGSEFSVATRTVHPDSTTDQSDPDALTKDENQLSNGSASSVVNSQTTVDINTNQFVSTFQQAY